MSNWRYGTVVRWRSAGQLAMVVRADKTSMLVHLVGDRKPQFGSPFYGDVFQWSFLAPYPTWEVVDEPED
jgi:hypothetical protein